MGSTCKFTSEGLLDAIGACIYDKRRWDAEIKEFHGEVVFYDEIPHRPTCPKYGNYTGMGADMRVWIRFVYGSQESFWPAMLERVVDFMQDCKERECWLRASGRCGEFSIMFSGNDPLTDHSLTFQEINETENARRKAWREHMNRCNDGNAMLCSDIPHATDETGDSSHPTCEERLAHYSNVETA